MRNESLIQRTDSGLYCAAGDFHIDPWRPVVRAVITGRFHFNMNCVPARPIVGYWWRGVSTSELYLAKL